MGNLLDELLGGSVTIEWDGFDGPFPKRAIFHFGENFSVADDPDGKKTVFGLRFIPLDGDVTGDSDENRVAEISGAGGTNTVNIKSGVCFEPRMVTGENTTLVTGDMLVFVDASAERNVTLAAPTAGRTVLIFITGAGPVTIKRPSGQLINGAASNYIAAADGRVMVTSDGTNYMTWAGVA